MTTAKRQLKFCLAFMLSWSMTFSPFLGIAIAPIAHAEEVDDSIDGQAGTLLEDLEKLLDRAIYPDVPRRGTTGTPTNSEITDIGQRLGVLRRDIQKNLLSEVSKITDPEFEGRPLVMLESFYAAVEKFEGLKFFVGQTVDPSTWDDAYTIKLPLRGVSQLNFVQTASYSSEHFAVLPPDFMPQEIKQMIAAQNVSMAMHLDMQRFELVFKLRPDFLEKYEQQQLLTAMTKKSSINFGVHFAVHRLQDSLAITRDLLRTTPESLPKLSDFWIKKFPSLGIQHDVLIKNLNFRVARERKPILLRSIMRALDRLAKKGKGWTLTGEFFDLYKAQEGAIEIERPYVAHDGPGNQNNIQLNELAIFKSALSSLINLWDLQNPSLSIGTIIYEAKLLSLRWLILNNPKYAEGLSEEGLNTLLTYFEAKARDLTNGILADNNLQITLAGFTPDRLRKIQDQQRKDFQSALGKAASKMKSYTKDRINLAYLIQAQNPSIQALELSPRSQVIMQLIERQPTYEAGYFTYKAALMTTLQYYTLPQPLSNKISLDDLDKYKDDIRWNNSTLMEIIPADYVNELNANAESRKKEVEDLIAVGRLLKFNKFEKIPQPKRDGPYPPQPGPMVSPETLELGDGWFARIFGSEMQAYAQAIQTDMYNASPLLGSDVKNTMATPKGTATTTMPLWQYLNSHPLKGDETYQVTDRQLQETHKQIYANLNELQVQTQKMDAGPDNDIGQVGETLRTLITRASQIGFLLTSFAGFDSFYGDMVDELMLPGFFEKEWENFSNWADAASTWMIAILVLQVVSSRFAGVGKLAADGLGRFFAPIFGVNFSRLQPLFIGMIGIAASAEIYKGWGPEAQRIEILKRFFNCSAAAPCVALYSDVEKQEDLAQYHRTKAIGIAAAAAAIVGGIRLWRWVWSRYGHSISSKVFKTFQLALSTLGIDLKVALNQRLLKDAFQAALKKARQEPDPRVATLMEMYVRQADLTISRTIWKEAKRWIPFDKRFGPELQKLGLGQREWKNMSSLTSTMERIETQYARGEMSIVQYEEAKSTMVAVFEALRPTWAKMEKDIALKNFYNHVWDLTTNKSMVEVNTSIEYFDKRIFEKFTKTVDKYYGVEKSRMGVPTTTPGRSMKLKQIVDNVIGDLKKNPAGAEERLSKIMSQIKEGMTP